LAPQVSEFDMPQAMPCSGSGCFKKAFNNDRGQSLDRLNLARKMTTCDDQLFRLISGTTAMGGPIAGVYAGLRMICVRRVCRVKH
jgi:hypothetical protein